MSCPPTKRRSLTIIVPFLDEEENLPAVHAEIAVAANALAALDVAVFVEYVDDGSKDESIAVLQAIVNHSIDPFESVGITRLARNVGTVSAIRAALEAVMTDAFIVIAADLQDPPSLIPELAQKWLAGSLVTIGVRESRDDPRLMRMASSIYYWLFRALVMPDFPRNGFDMMLIDSYLIDYYRDSSRSFYPQVLTIWLEPNPAVVPYHRPARLHGKAKWSMRRRVGALVDIITSYSTVPLRIVTVVGLATAFVSFAYGTAVVISALMGYARPSGLTTLLAAITFLLGTTLVAIGIVGEYLLRVFREFDNRPIFRVRSRDVRTTKDEHTQP
jgi:glycosyltransferase involved in cell wall biosynthesis